MNNYFRVFFSFKLLLIGVLMFVLSENSFSQSTKNEDSFPGDWLGTYKGKMYIINRKKGLVDSLDLKFDLLPDSINRWIYRMTYKGEKFREIIKDYYLLKPDSLDAGSYLLDEKDGIIIEQTLLANTFYSNFSVAGNYLSSSLRKIGNTIYFEVISAKKKEHLSTKNEAKPGQIVFEVKSFPPNATQKAILKKE